MDKALTKKVVEGTGVRQARYYLALRYDFERNAEAVVAAAAETLGAFPVFVKPCSQGSSVGVAKANNLLELAEGLTEAFKLDTKVLVEEFIVTSGVMTVKTMLNKPEFLASNPAMMAECRKIWQDYWDACTSTNGYNAAGRHYSELCDVDSMVGYWLTMVTMENSDSTKKSRYAYKDQGGKIVWGPVWDFDWGCGSPVTVSQNSDGSWKWSSATNTFGVRSSTAGTLA